MMIFLIPKLNLGIGETGVMFCDLQVSLKHPFAGIYKCDEFVLFDFGFARRHIRFSEL